MPIDTARARKSLKDFDLKTLFIEELGWDRHTATLDVLVDGQSMALNAIAEKRGMVAFAFNGRIPDYPTRRKIERQVAKSAHEHLIIFTDPHKTTQTWQWVKREASKPTACREHTYHRDQPGDALIQKLQAIAFGLEEEETLTIAHVAGRARAAFDLERVTKRFYERFKTEHAAFLNFIKGIPDEELHRWYASVMLNRLMFIYFIQKKGFLNNDRDYLKNKLAQCKRELGNDRFYRDFLCSLFFEGFAKHKEDRSDKARRLFGEVPYLNGGIFMPHQIEQLHGKAIHIADAAFEQLFSFFDQYHWHLDERPLRADNEINPDVLGYIFEKYINQKQMGAYYTKEDITGYISQNTVIPLLFDGAQQKYKIAFEGEQSIWRLLQADPDRYIYDAVKKGVEKPLPSEIAVGLDEVSKRTEWNKPASEEYALPTEIWREVVARRKRYQEVRAKLANGDIRDINDLITYNFDIRQFAQDVIENCEGPELLRAFWHNMESITVLDPTCGSGAFLFAALNTLEPLYEACLNRMEAFVTDLDHSGQKHRPEKLADFRKLLERVALHPNSRYFIFKSIIINNLYGVDIMEEAVEICKLRLFLKLVAQVERAEDIEPLPDIDFNIRAGNTLVGYTSLEQVHKVQKQKSSLGYWNDERIDEEAEIADRAFSKFQEMQTEQGMKPADFAEAKENLRSRLKTLTDELDRFLAEEYGIDERMKDEVKGMKKGEDGPSSFSILPTSSFAKWLASHKPFHWFIEFYGIMKSGGFDVVIGNPPYVATSKADYELKADLYSTLTSGNLYALIIERSVGLLLNSGRFGMIVPVSMVSGDGFIPLAQLVFKRHSWASYYSNRPGKLFQGVEQRLTIALAQNTPGEVYSSCYHHWYEEERPYLFQKLAYARSELIERRYMPLKVGNGFNATIVRKMAGLQRGFSTLEGRSRRACWFHDGPTYWIRAIPFEPTGNQSNRSNHYHPMYGVTDDHALAMTSILSSSTFYFHYKLVSNCRDFGVREISSFRTGLFSENEISKLSELGSLLGTRLKKTARRCVRDYPSGTIEYDEYYPSSAKDIIDEVDRVLAKHYGFTDEEMDFIINYDIKYRMGREVEENEG